jgi:hypothetical protein
LSKHEEEEVANEIWRYNAGGSSGVCERRFFSFSTFVPAGMEGKTYKGFHFPAGYAVKR